MVKKLGLYSKENHSCSLDKKSKFSAYYEKKYGKLHLPISFRFDECSIIRNNDIYSHNEMLIFENQTMPLKILVIKTMLEIIKTKYKDSMKPSTYLEFSTVLDQLIKTVEELCITG